MEEQTSFKNSFDLGDRIAQVILKLKDDLEFLLLLLWSASQVHQLRWAGALTPEPHPQSRDRLCFKETGNDKEVPEVFEVWFICA